MKTAQHFRHSVLVGSMALMILSGCTKEEGEDIIPETTLEMSYPAIPFTVHAGDVVNGQYALNLDINANVLAQVLAAKHYSLAQLTTFKFTKANLFLTSPAAGNYNAVQEVTLQVAVDQSPPVAVAGLDPVPNGAQTLLLQMGDVNVLDLMKSSHVHFVVQLEMDGPLPAVSSHSLVLNAKVGVAL